MHEWIRATIENTANEQLLGNLSIGRLSGDLLNHVVITDIQLSADEPILLVDSLTIRYSIRSLFSRTLQINELSVVRPQVFLEMVDDTLWNVQRLFPETEETESSGSLPITILAENAGIYDGSISVKGDFLPDEFLSIKNIDLLASAGFSDAFTSFTLQELTFQILEGRLPEPITVRTKASLENEKITLQELLVDTGRSVLRSSAFFNTETGSLNAEAGFSPLAAKDVHAYLDEIPDFDTATITITTKGKLSDIDLSVDLFSKDVIHLTAGVGFSIDPEPKLTSLNVLVKDLNPKAFPQLEEFATSALIGEIRFSMDGELLLSEPFESELEGMWSVNHVRWDHIHARRVEGTYKLKNRAATIAMSANFPGQSLKLNAEIAQISMQPADLVWKGELDFNALDIAYFMDEPEWKSNLNGRVNIAGKGIEPAQKRWDFSLYAERPEIMGYSVEEFSLIGSIDALTVNMALNVAKFDNEAKAELNIRQWNDNMPEWDMVLHLNNLNIEQLADLEGVDSRLNISLNGNGFGFSPEEIQAVIKAEMFPSLLLGQRIDGAVLNAQVDQGFLTISDSFFESRFADVHLSAFQNINDLTDAVNQLEYTIQLKNMEAFARVLPVDTLSVSGVVTGEMKYADEKLVFKNMLQFEHFIFDELHIAAINGTLNLEMEENPQAFLKLTLVDPGFGEFDLKNISIDVQALIAEHISGISKLVVLGGDDTLMHEASFSLVDDTFKLNTTQLMLKDPEFDLFLTEPFSVILHGESIKMDTLRMESSGIAEIKLHFSQLASGELNLFTDARALNLSALERSVMKSASVQGFIDVFADITFKSDEELRLNAAVQVDSLVYGAFDMDSMQLILEIAEGRLISDFEIVRKGKKILESQFNLPFVAADPQTLDDRFFEQSLSGFLKLKPQSLQDYEGLWEWLGLDNLSGVAQADMVLEGTAGRPDFDFIMLFREGIFSGVPVDSLSFGLRYNHDDERLHLNSVMHSLGQKAFTAVGSLPFLIDWRAFTLAEDALEGQLVCDITTNQFDLAALNTFLDRDVARNLRGRSTSAIQIRGNVQKPEISGTMSVSGGQIFLVDNNITLRNIRMEAELRPDLFELKELFAESVGDIRINGMIHLDGFFPERFDFQTRANRFRISHTRDLEMLIGLNGSLSGTPERPRLAGEILLDRGYIYLDNFGESAVEVVILEDEEVSSNIAEILYDRLELEMTVRADGRFFLRNRNRPELNLELQGAVDAVKEPGEELELFGDMSAIRGYANQLGRRFVLDEGQILFSGPATNPELSIRLKYELRREDDITIWYIITGDVENPVFAYESQPEMELQDTISYIIFGRPFNALSGWQQGVSGGASAGNVVADAALDLLIERLESLAADRLGIDVLEIDNSGDNSGTTIKAGKYFGDRLFVAIMQELSSDPTSKVIIEYLLRRNLELIFTGSDDYRTGVDIRWRLDY